MAAGTFERLESSFDTIREHLLDSDSFGVHVVNPR